MTSSRASHLTEVATGLSSVLPTLDRRTPVASLAAASGAHDRPFAGEAS
jgi:hypothetical protein